MQSTQKSLLLWRWRGTRFDGVLIAHALGTTTNSQKMLAVMVTLFDIVEHCQVILGIPCKQKKIRRKYCMMGAAENSSSQSRKIQQKY